MRGHPRGRRPTPCRHCDMVESYQLERVNDEQYERQPRTFKEWLGVYRYETEGD